MPPVTGLITLDVHDHPNLNSVLQASADFFTDSQLHVTYFVPAGLIRRELELGGILRRMTALGHTVGCHGLNHTREEDFPSLEPKRERQILAEATAILEDTLGSAINAFRAPLFRLSKNTLPFLAELRYKADLSVTPQRLPFLSSTPWSYAGFLAPRSPYRPHRSSPYRKGNLPIIEIPVSCLMLPLAHGAMTVLRSWGLPAMARMLIWEARVLDRTLVLCLHPESIAGEDYYFPDRPWRWSDLIPRVWGGLQLRYHFGDIPPEKSLVLSRDMVKLATCYPELKLVSANDYLDNLRSTNPLELSFPRPDGTERDAEDSAA
jgi:peptidoglycan/xylan/chitin deacetylase (PgdA/CDA1 family)